METKLNELEAKADEMEQLELKIEKQELLLTALKQSNSLRDSTSENERQMASLRQVAPAGSSQVPRCCCDLLCMGETVSGLYSIMGNTSVEMVYCDFSKPPEDPSK